MRDFEMYMPTKVISGNYSSGKIGSILKECNINSVLIVTDPGIIQANLLTNTERLLSEHDVRFQVFDSVEANPKASTVRNGISVAKEGSFDAIIGFGGGSSIDTAKAIAFMATNEGDALDYEGLNTIINDPLPIIAIPTTSGTGSEVTASAVITDEESLFKVAIVSPKLFPSIAILDPVLTLNCPQGITAATGMDALTHALESYVSKQTNLVSKALALHAIKLITANLPKSYFYGSDLESRKNMLEASMIAGFAFSQSRLGNVHAISQSFGGVFNIPHGIANATLLPYILKFNMHACLDEMCEIAQAMGIESGDMDKEQIAFKLIDKIVEMNELLNIPNNIKDLGVDLKEIDTLVKDSMRSGNILVNPRITSAKDVEKIIRAAYEGQL